MTERDPSPRTDATDPAGTVRLWWERLARGDLDAWSSLLAADYTVVGGPGGRVRGRSAVVAEAEEFARTGHVEHWSVEDVSTQVGHGIAVCTYRWAERVRIGTTGLHLSGWATDVLVGDGRSWRHRSRHVSASADDAPPASGPGSCG
jgi:hypothetical protein